VGEKVATKEDRIADKLLDLIYAVSEDSEKEEEQSSHIGVFEPEEMRFRGECREVVDTEPQESVQKEPRIVEELLRLMESEEGRKKIEAIRNIGELRDGDAALPLGEILRDENYRTRCEIVVALGKLGDSRGVPALTEIMDEPEIGRLACDSLLALGEKSVPELTAVALEAHSKKRILAISLLEKIGDSRALYTFERLSSDADKKVAGRAQKALSCFPKA
jgi:HEAT repeat protein